MWKPIGYAALCAGTLAGLVVAACSDSAGPADETTFGSPVAVSDGGATARTFLTLDPDGTPIEFGIAIQDAFDNLPATEMPDERVLPLPDGASALPFDHATIQ